MPRVFIPPQMRSLTEGREVVDARGAHVREVLEDIEVRFPGIMDRLCQDGSLRPDVSVVVGGAIATLGLLQRVEPDTEIHFLPVLAGG